jgi:hypothetical protein
MAFADKATVRLVEELGAYQGTGFVLGERPVKYGCVIRVATARHIVARYQRADEATAEAWVASKITLDKGGILAARVTWAAVGDAGVAEFHSDVACKANGYTAVVVSKAAPVAGQAVFSLGYPVGHKFFSWGYVLEPSAFAADETGQVAEYLSAMVPSAPGHSGGALFTEAGEVVGLLSGGYPIAPSMSFWATISQINAAVSQWPEWEAYLGK